MYIPEYPPESVSRSRSALQRPRQNTTHGHSLVLDTKLIPWIQLIRTPQKLIQCKDKINSSCALEWSFPGLGYEINPLDTSNSSKHHIKLIQTIKIN